MRGIAAVAGTFDVLHAGHIATLQFAKALGDRLIVLLYNDALSTRLKNRQPIFNLVHRKAVITALRCVDEVRVCDDGVNSLELILSELKPRFFVGGDPIKSKVDEAIDARSVVELYDGAVVGAPLLLAANEERLSGSYVRKVIYAEAGLDNGE